MASPQVIYALLCDAVSQDPSRVEAGYQQLRLIEKEQGTFDHMQSIAAERSIPLDVRRMAIIQVKNAISSNWRAKTLYTEQHRTNIRARSATFFDEPDDTIAECNAIIVSKIGRLEYPRQWPSLITDLMGFIRSNVETRFSSPGGNPQATLILRRTLKVLNQVLKELAAMKMPSNIQTMAQLVDEIHGFLGSIYAQFISVVQDTLTPTTLDSFAVVEDLRVAHLTYKALVKLMTWAAPRLWQEKFESLQNIFAGFFQVSAAKFQYLSDLRLSIVVAHPRSSKAVEVLTTHVRLFGKFFRRVQQATGSKFITLPSCNDLVLFYWSKIVQATAGPPEYIDDSPTAVFPVRYVVQGMALFRESLRLWAPRNAMDDGNTPKVLSPEFVESAVQLLIGRFLPFWPSDLERWSQDPEGWFDAEESDAWEFDLRPCAERVLLSLSVQYASVVGPLLQSHFTTAIDPQFGNSLPILTREAIYCAVGRCARSLRGLISLETVLAQVLARQAVEPHHDPNYHILKRAIAWMLGKWFAEHGGPPPIPQVWEILAHLLQDRKPGSDIVVRLTAATSLRECIDSVDFNVDMFSPFVGPVVKGMVELILEAETVESKRRVADALNTAIERVETRIVPFIPEIVKHIPDIWARPETDVLFKGSLLVTVTRLVEASKEHAGTLTPIVVPLVRESFAPAVKLQLDADGLILWLAALRNASGIETGSVTHDLSLFDLLPDAVALLAENLDLLGSVASIVESYILLDVGRLLQSQALNLHVAFLRAMSQAVSSNVKDILQTVNLLVQVAPASLWAEAMHTSGLFASLLQTVIEDKVSALLIVEHYYIFARICLQDPRVFVQLMSATATSLGIQEDVLFNGLLDQWWKKFDNVAEPSLRKLMVMGIACLAATGHKEVVWRLPHETFDMWVDVLTEIKEAQEEVPQDGVHSPLTAFWRDETSMAPSTVEEIKGTIEEQRRQEVWVRDPVRTQTFKIFLRGKIREIEMACGSQMFKTLVLDKADPSLFEQLQKELTR